MDIQPALLDQAAREGLITQAQGEALWRFLQARTADRPAFRATHILYYLGGLVAIGAMTLFMTLGFERFGGAGLLVIALAYAAAGVALAELAQRRGLVIPAGIAAAFVVALTPLAVYGLQVMLGWWPHGMVYREYHTRIDWRWIFMELATLAAGAVVLGRYRLPFLLMPVAVTLWYMSMDLAPFLAGGVTASWDVRKKVSLAFGALMLACALAVDWRTRRESRDFAFWLYLFGALAFWGGLTMLRAGSELAALGYLAVNLALLAAGAALARRTLAVFGGLGVACYLGHLAYGLFRDSMLFPFALTAVGLGVVGLGIAWQRHEAAIERSFRAWLPGPLADLAAARHG
jgi:hypothetical protein